MRIWCLIVFVTFLKTNAQNIDYKNQVKNLSKKAENFIVKNKDSSYYYYYKILKLLEGKKDWESLISNVYNSTDVAFYHYDFNKLNENLQYLDSLYFAKHSYLRSLPNYLELKNYLNYYKGFYNFRLNNYKSSKIAFSSIISSTENLQDSAKINRNKAFLSVAYNYLGKISSNEMKYKEAIDFYNKNIRFIETQFTQNHNNLFSTYSLLAEALKRDNQIQKSNTLYLKSLKYFNSKKSANSSMVAAFNITQNYIKLSKLDSAKFYLNIAKSYLTETHIYNSRYYDISSEISSVENDYENAIQELNFSLDFMKKKLNSLKNTRIADIYNNMGLVNSKFNQQKVAIKNYNLALNQFSEDSTNSTINQTIKFKILKHKTNALNQLKNYALTVKTTDAAIAILDSLKPSFKTNGDKLFLIENAFPLFENGIKAAYKLFKETKDSKYIDQAFFYSEKSKSTLLIESLLSAQATQFANIPDNLIEKEKQLKAKTTYLEKRIAKKASSELQDELFDLKQTRRNLIKDIEINYKGYYDLKYNTQVLSLNKLQDWLNDDTVLISYFYGANAIYTITITKQFKHINVIKLDAGFEKLLKDTYNALSFPKSDINALQAKTNALYNILAKPSLNQVSKKGIIIVPDGLLNYLPFESLYTNESSKYLIENYTFSYINSATLLMQLQAKKQNNNQVLAFAPKFENSNTSSLLPLPNNKKEVKQLLTHFKGESLINNDASLENFNTKNNHFGIIHLATHAIIDDENPEFSYLAFTPNSKNENLLYTNDLYNLQLNADMVTLSTCESGIGDLKRGEGMMSLARGFYFSGTSSIASTLWKVNDASSSQLMDGFYKNLSKGNLKDVSLQRAKIDFLKTNKDNALSHPYYWSGFIISGNTNALVSSFNWMYLALGILVLLILLFVYKRKKS